MSNWSEFCKKYAIENGISYTAASKLPEVKELYKLQKAEFISTNIEEAIISFEEEKALEEFIEPLVFAELPEDATVTVTYELPVVVQTPKIFISKIKKIKKIAVKRA
jgi:hypothetical protein